MAVVSMMQIRIIALTEYRKPLMELLQRRGVVQLQNDLPHDDVFERLDITAPCAQFQRGAQAAEQALEILSRYAPQKAGPLDSLKGRAPLAPGMSFRRRPPRSFSWKNSCVRPRPPFPSCRCRSAH